MKPQSASGLQPEVFIPFSGRSYFTITQSAAKVESFPTTTSEPSPLPCQSALEQTYKLSPGLPIYTQTIG